MRDDPSTRDKRQQAAIEKLTPLGFRATDWMLFEKGGCVYDLSAADLDQIDRIERERLFVFSYTSRGTARNSIDISKES